VCAAALCAPSHFTAAACGIYSSARVVAFGATGFRCRARSAAGVTWTCRTSSAQRAGRWGHTSVVDAAGAIYVIGGIGGTGGIYYNDVWASTNGGARAGPGQRGWSGGTQRGTQGVV
jgi:hypothetical protein